MSSNNTALELPNPYTPLAFLPPDFASQTETACYLCVGALSAFMWDWLVSMGEEYKIIRNTRGFSLPIFVYFLSRIGTLGYCVTAVVFQVGSVADCHVLLYIIGAFSILAVPATSMLFFIRVRAVYENSKVITYIFGCTWLAVLGGALIVPFAIFGEHLGSTRRCIMTGMRSYGSTVIVVNTINDTLVFIAISGRIILFGATGDTWQDKCKSFLHGDSLQRLSKHILQSGQLYYFATIGFSIAACTMLMAPGIPKLYQCILALLDICLQNAMACRVFRNVKLNFKNDVQSFTISGTNFRFNSYHSGFGNQVTLEQPGLQCSSTDITKMTDFSENAGGSHEV